MANEVFNLFPSSVHLIDIENYDAVKENFEIALTHQTIEDYIYNHYFN